MAIEPSNNKQSTILTDLRGLIVSGHYAANDRLPSRREMAGRLGVSSFTVQQSLDRLAQDGFVRPMGKRGTFVRADAPHLCQYAMVFAVSPSDPGEPWSHYYSALRSEAAAIGNAIGKTIKPYYGIDAHGDSDDYKQLVSEIERERLAGIIFTALPNALVHTPIMTHSRLPRVALMDKAFVPGIPAVFTEYFGVLDRAMERMASLGRKRVAIITAWGNPGGFREFILSRSAVHGLAIESAWIQNLSHRCVGWAPSLVELLFRGDASKRPDGLIIADDNLVEGVTRGLLMMGIQAPTDVEVIAHANFPWPTMSHVPAKRVGLDLPGILRKCVEYLDQQRAGQIPPAVTLLRPLFDDELGRP